MGLWNSNDRKEAVLSDMKRRKEEVLASLPHESEFYTAFRTNPIANFTPQGEVFDVDFWAAIRVERGHWRIMRYTFWPQNVNATFVSMIEKDGLTFAEAAYEISKYEVKVSDFMQDERYKAWDLYNITDKKLAESVTLQRHFGIEHYRKALEEEGISFDRAGYPNGMRDGLCISNGRFNVEDVDRSIVARENARDNPPPLAQIKAGLLSEILAGVGGADDVDAFLKKRSMLTQTDKFAAALINYYLALQKEMGVENPNLDNVLSLSGKDRRKFEELWQRQSDTPADEHLSKADEILEQTKSMGKFYVEPWALLVQEARIFRHLLSARSAMKSLKEGMADIFNAASGAADEASIRQDLEKAEERFRAIGGTDTRLDRRVRAYIMTGDDPKVPHYLAETLTQYYEERKRTVDLLARRPERAQPGVPIPFKAPPRQPQ